MMKLATVHYDSGEGQRVDALLSETALHLRGRGWRIAGTVQANDPRPDGCRCKMTLIDLASGERINATENRGPLARGCQLDTAALEQAVGLAISSLTPAIDLVIINRFGKREAEGKGFRPLIEAAVELDIPVLIGVNRSQRAAWHIFSGEAGTTLDPDAEAIRGWCEMAVDRRIAHTRTSATSPNELPR